MNMFKSDQDAANTYTCEQVEYVEGGSLVSYKKIKFRKSKKKNFFLSFSFLIKLMQKNNYLDQI